jgi:DNA adenine methylase
MLMKVPRPIMRYHGGKYRLAPWIISHFPSHRVYVEPFGGAASVLMQKPRSSGEVYNDLDGEMVNVMQVLRNRDRRAQLIEALSLTPYARAEFDAAWEPATDPVERARRTFVRAEMGFGSAGATKGNTGFRIDTTRNSCTAMKVWASMPQMMADFGQRLAGVLLENRDALKLLGDHDGPRTLFYVDPPYMPQTRKLSSACYRYEMDETQHAQLLDVLTSLEGMVVLSGYAHKLYEQKLCGWRRVEKRSPIAARVGSALRTEVLWLSPNVQNSTDLFGG